jgi:signal transduction histidine kinase
MKNESLIPSKYLIGLAWALALFGLYLTSLHSYLLFHSLAEIFSIVVACAIFMVAWNSRQFLDNNYLLFIGIAYLFVGGFDLLHTLAYKGMGVLPGYGANLPTQLWIATRYIESFSLLIAPVFIGRKLRPSLILTGYSLVTAVLLATIFYWRIFPDCFLEGVGLTPFKKISEYLISVILAGSIALLVRKQKAFDRHVLRLLVASIFLTIAAELAFTFYVSVYGISNLFGHFCKIISFYLIYKAVIETGLRKPYDLFFRDLKQSEEAQRDARDELELRVEERTADLVEANERLRQEIEERKRVEEALRKSEKELRFLSAELLNAQESERARFARELHDGIGQALSTIKVRVEALAKIAESDVSRLRVEDLENLVPMLRQTIEEVRNTCMDLRPSTLDSLGIVPTINWFSREFQTAYPFIQIEKKIDIQEAEVPDALKIVIYRIVQEAFNNAAKHSEAEFLQISLAKTDGEIRLAVEDNGQGFDLKELLLVDTAKRCFGLTSMKERAELSGGSFSIESGIGQGTTVRATWKV